MLGAGTVEYSAGPLQRLRLGNGTYIRIKGLLWASLSFHYSITFPPKRGFQITEEMSNISRVKGEERPLFRHTVREKQAYNTAFYPFRLNVQCRHSGQGEGPGTGEPPSDAQAIQIIHFGYESALPRATRRRLTPVSSSSTPNDF
jgi:hypothetical protein